ncbi:DUF6008 family protein [Catenulispora yoronensis]
MPNMPGMPGMQSGAHSVPLWDTLGALGLLAWAVAMWLAVAGLAFADRQGRRMWVYKSSLAVILIGVAGQIGHLLEHVAQAVYWIGHPEAPAWMTPWGTGMARGFGQIDRSRATLGMEILHLVGNFIFLAGLAAVMVITRRARRTRTRHWGRMGVWMQGIHGLEHLALTISVWLGAKQAVGLSTWFGQLQPGPGATTYRIWWHFLANVAGSVIFVLALWNLRRERGQICDGFRDTPVRPTAPVDVLV